MYFRYLMNDDKMRKDLKEDLDAFEEEFKLENSRPKVGNLKVTRPQPFFQNVHFLVAKLAAFTL